MPKSLKKAAALGVASIVPVLAVSYWIEGKLKLEVSSITGECFRGAAKTALSYKIADQITSEQSSPTPKIVAGSLSGALVALGCNAPTFASACEKSEWFQLKASGSSTIQAWIIDLFKVVPSIVAIEAIDYYWPDPENPNHQLLLPENPGN